jgi:hypothetical protein
MRLLGLDIFKDSPNDSKMLIPFVEKLFHSRIIRSEDIIVCDKGFTSKANDQIIINRFNEDSDHLSQEKYQFRQDHSRPKSAIRIIFELLPSKNYLKICSDTYYCL